MTKFDNQFSLRVCGHACVCIKYMTYWFHVNLGKLFNSIAKNTVYIQILMHHIHRLMVSLIHGSHLRLFSLWDVLIYSDRTSEMEKKCLSYICEYRQKEKKKHWIIIWLLVLTSCRQDPIFHLMLLNWLKLFFRGEVFPLLLFILSLSIVLSFWFVIVTSDFIGMR